MKGSVKILGITSDGVEQLLAEKENLTTVGFSEQITDLLTTPSSVKFPTAENTYILDSSNYEIQGFSMSKNADQFRQNLHSYKTVNLLHNSNLKDSSGWILSDVTLSANIILGYASGVSGSLLTSQTSAGSFKQWIKYDNTTGNFSGNYFSGTNLVGSVDVKLNMSNVPAQTSSDVNGGYIGHSTLSVYHGNQTAVTFIMWDSSGVATLRDVQETASWLGGIKDIGGGWHRVFLLIEPSNATITDTLFSISPALGKAPYHYGASTVKVDSSAGSIYIARPQLELGRVPTNYVETSSYFSTRDNTLAFSLLNNTYPYGKASSPTANNVVYNYFIPSGTGGLSLSAVYGVDSTDRGVSAYIPYVSSITPDANPNDRGLTIGAITPVEEALGIEFTQEQLPNTLNLSGDLQLSTYNKSWSYTSGYTSELGRHVAYLGSYGVRTSDHYTWLNFISAVDYDGYANPLQKKVFNNGANNQCLDRFGYWELSSDGTFTGADAALNAATAPNSTEFIKIVNSDFSSTGEITYRVQLYNTPTYQRDTPWLNAFGGVDILGLWGLDLNKIREDDITANPPYSRPDIVDPKIDPVRRYKLFNKLVLTDNISKMAGAGAVVGYAGNYIALNIYWKVKFL